MVASQNYQKIGDSIEVVLEGYKEGKIQWQFSDFTKKWIDLKNQNGVELKTKFFEDGFYRAKVINCNQTFLSIETLVETIPLTDYEYVDSIGKYLSSDELGGRSPGTHGDSLASSFINKQFYKNSLKTLNGESFYKSFKTANGKTTFNMVGLIPGVDSLLKKEIIVISAHYDHIGQNSTGIFNGADDNASGVSGLLLLTRLFKNFRPKRTLLFITTGAEEPNPYLQGMKEFINKKYVNITDIKYVFNCDMIGRLRDNQLYIYGKNYGNDIVSIINIQNKNELKITFNTNNSFGNSTSDHVLFESYQIPTFTFTSGPHSDYHTIRDKWDKININGIIKIVFLDFNIINYLASE